jgi:hypothetical protein
VPFCADVRLAMAVVLERCSVLEVWPVAPKMLASERDSPTPCSRVRRHRACSCCGARNGTYATVAGGFDPRSAFDWVDIPEVRTSGRVRLFAWRNPKPSP